MAVTGFPMAVLVAVTLVTLVATLVQTATVAQRIGVESHNKVVVCYVGTWAVYRPGGGLFSVEHIDPKLCTHVVYAFAGLDSQTNSIKSLDPYLDLEENYGKGNFRKTTDLKKNHPHLKVTLAIGGWNEGSTNFSLMAKNPAARANFTKSAFEIIKKYNFDGLDLDWEFPTKRGGNPEDKANFVELIKDLRKVFDSENLILTAAISASVDTIKDGYDLPALYQYLDLVHLMSYDYHGTWDPVSGVNAPLKSKSPSDMLTVERSVDYVLQNGLKADKLVLGLPLYGRTFMLDSPKEEVKLGQKASSPKDFQGPFTRSDGFLGYLEICEDLSREGWEKAWDNETETPYAYRDALLISYDDPESIKEKVTFAMDRGLAGLMVWSIDTDDFKGACGEGPYPLLKAISTGVVEALSRPPPPTSTVTPVDDNTIDTKEPSSSVKGSAVLAFVFLCAIFAARF